MKKTLVALAASTALAGAARAQNPAGSGPAAPGPMDINRIVAVVGDSAILLSDVQEQINAVRQSGRPIPQDSAGQAQLARDLLTRLVDEALLVQEAQRQQVEVTDADVAANVEQAMQQIRSRFSSDSEYRAELKQVGFGSPAEYRRWYTENQKRTLLQRKLFEKLRAEGKLTSAPVSQQAVDSAFRELKASGQLPPLPASVTFRQVVIAPQPSPKEDSVARAKADSLLAEIHAGGDFAQIAKRESMDQASKEQGGELGWQRRGSGLLPVFERVIFSLPPGRVSPVFRTSFGYHIVEVERAQPAEVKVRQILIRPRIDSVDVAAARRLADSVATLWRNGAVYDSLVAKYHDPSEARVIPNPFPREQLPQSYQSAMTGKKDGDITDPFPVEDKSRGAPKFIVVQLTSVDEGHDATLADYQEKIRAQLGQTLAYEKYVDGLRNSTFVSIRF
jgi:peptidyl-prolyl cis-trans isomerase SurA